jgi:hypothetical protein
MVDRHLGLSQKNMNTKLRKTPPKTPPIIKWGINTSSAIFLIRLAIAEKG